MTRTFVPPKTVTAAAQVASDASETTEQTSDTLQRDDPLTAGQESYASRGQTRQSVLSASQHLLLPADSQCDAPRCTTDAYRNV